MTTVIHARSIHLEHFNDEILALALQLEELTIHRDSSKGKNKKDCPTDQDLAVSTIQLEIQNNIQLVNDLVLAHSLAIAIDTDSKTISATLDEELQIQQDRQLARSLDGKDFGHVANNEAEKNECSASETQDEVSGLNANEERQTDTMKLLIGELIDNLEAEAGPSSTYSERQKLALQKINQHEFACVACDERPLFHKVVKAPCGDAYCLDCLKKHVMRTIKAKTMFPPKCCRQEIPLDIFVSKLSPQEIRAFRRAQIEFATVNKIYCSSVDCGQFILPTQIDRNGSASCEFCQSLTCMHCKQPFHEDECPEDPDLQAAVAVINQQGWKRCYMCNMFVELNMGCNHITCQCGGQFCYECSAPWKTCDCDQWREENLTNRAEEVVDRDAVGYLPPLARARRIQQVRQELEQHECDHPGIFERVFNAGRRRFRCEMCEDRHWKYILRCRHCHIQICEDCRRYRVR